MLYDRAKKGRDVVVVVLHRPKSLRSFQTKPKTLLTTESRFTKDGREERPFCPKFNFRVTEERSWLRGNS